jgi:tripartite-type tricarboxylate transporter receptor subunit TctC
MAERHIMMKSPASLAPLALAATLTLTGATAATAQAPTLAGKIVRMITGFGPGGGYDMWGRLVARHIGEHLPGNPTVISENMPGAGSYAAAGYVYNIASKDGTVMALIARDAALGPITGTAGATFDPLKISWIGTPTTETNVCIAYNTSLVKVKTVADLYRHQLIVGDTGAGNGTYTYPKALDGLLGMKFKLVGGFPETPNVFLAMERGEVDGICESLDSVKDKRPTWIPENKVVLLFQGGARPDPEIRDVPFVDDLARTTDEKQAIEFLYAGQAIGRPFVAPPNLSAGVLKMLRDAFDATMTDPEFLADAKKEKRVVRPESGEYLASLMTKIYATPKPIVDRIARLIR